MDDTHKDGPGSDRDGENPELPRDEGSRFVELLGENERSLFGYIFAMTCNWDDSQEVMQRLRIRLWEQFQSYDRSRPFGAWARAIAYYLVLEFRKERSRRRECLSDRTIQIIDETYAAESEEISSSRDELLVCLQKLPSDQLKLVTEYYQEGGAAALAAALDKTANAIRQAVLRIRRILMDCVQRNLNTSFRNS